MISSIYINNLQIHKDTKLELVAPGVNVIVGQSRQGKASVFRAVRKVVDNRPVVGLEAWVHKHNPKNIISVGLNTTDGHAVVWQGPKEQKYIVDGEAFAGFGQAVPELVSEVLNIDELNMQHQFDPPFLVFDAPGQVARRLNQVVNLEIIDKVLAVVAAKKRRNEQEIRTVAGHIEALEEQEAAFPDLEAAEEFVSDLEGMEFALLEKQAKLRLAINIQNQLAVVDDFLMQIALPPGVEEQVADLLQKQNLKAQQEYTLNLLINIQGALTHAAECQIRLAPLLAHEDAVSHLIEKQKYFKSRQNILARLVSLQQQIQSVDTELTSKRAIIEEMEAEFSRLMPDRCPLCGK